MFVKKYVFRHHRWLHTYQHMYSNYNKIYVDTVRQKQSILIFIFEEPDGEKQTRDYQRAKKVSAAWMQCDHNNVSECSMDPVRPQ